MSMHMQLLVQVLVRQRPAVGMEPFCWPIAASVIVVSERMLSRMLARLAPLLGTVHSCPRSGPHHDVI